ncbi:putative methylesterase 11 [Hibiscus syriacus]|uniref:non-specific serine/threonine protein kinase n=1 Tax=Hibiscus syriacus TaxID=106335 RepID=A0A6A3BH95_HIBSY|nr:putative methylesterase 11 [Hibiscus syriacus]
MVIGDMRELFYFAFHCTNIQPTNGLDSAVLHDICPRLITFSYSELKAATEDFSSSKKLGEGGFRAVYKGTISDGTVVAVKQLSIASDQGRSQFIAEIATISAVQHRNLDKLHGCCFEGKRHLLVYEFLENKGLDQAHFEHSGLHLDWPTHYNICLETARGLAYLHEESRPKIIHREVKAGNIMRDAGLCLKISDFGLANLYDDRKMHISTRVAGTIGYLAPEYAMRGHLTEKADVVGFGIVALEILNGRPNSDKSMEDDKIYLLEWRPVVTRSRRWLSRLGDGFIAITCACLGPVERWSSVSHRAMWVTHPRACDGRRVLKQQSFWILSEAAVVVAWALAAGTCP